MPSFVVDELRDYLRCGVLARGAVRFLCEHCGRDRLVALSCKGRGFCPRCMGRRMTEMARHWVSAVLPRVRVRQWVLSLPFALRVSLAYHYELGDCVVVEPAQARRIGAPLGVRFDPVVLERVLVGTSRLARALSAPCEACGQSHPQERWRALEAKRTCQECAEES